MSLTSFEKHDSYKDSGVGWIGEVPQHWELRANKHLFQLEKRTVGKRSSEFDLLSLTLRGLIKRDMENPEGKFPAEFDTYQEVLPGDFVFCLFDVEETPRTVGLSSFSGMITGAYTVYRPLVGSDPKFLYYFYLNADTDKKMRGLYKGLRNTIPKDAFASFKTPLPPLAEQRAIASFLDEKCEKIDEAVRIKEAQIARLRERRQILIQEAVTRGLNPDAPMKDSGIDWIGQIPAHWDQVHNKRIFTLKKDTVGKRSGDYDLLSLTLRGIIKRDMENPEGKFPADFDTYQEVCEGDFVFCHFDVEETPRTVGLSDFFGMITGAYTVYSVTEAFNRRFLLHFYIFADTGKKMRGLYKGLRNTIPKDAFATFKTPMPPIAEQQRIVEHIDTQSKKIEDAIILKQNQITALKEYKTSLINAAVTGKIKVI
ncbi:type I restriction enzyme S subunit [Yoonia maricola]|uniref:Type I restriction enzyme S subunit n=1 Tax=Yoonia maricola TaxID=420999 RepID=A0A2M8W5L2_9RHOB|nr:restriction endonuclease subunit S [Yoonia maricola]PJI86209.1 type I restriction enzyme S subunit [Yoonia maricola]